MIDVIEYKGSVYPAFQATGNAARFSMPFALEVCKGSIGLDIGANRSEWSLPGSILIDPVIDPTHDALDLPNIQVDYIHSSHCLEHLSNWVDALDHWTTRLRRFGVLFLYLPHPSQTYWLPFNNRKHIHSFTPELIRSYLEDRGWNKIFISDRDLNNSFIAIAEK